MLDHLALDVLAQVHRAGPRSHVLPFVVAGLVLAVSGAYAARRLTGSRAAALLAAAAGVALATAVTLTLFRGGYRDGDLARCVVTDPVLLSADGVTNLLLLAPAAFLAVLAVGRPVQVAVGAGLVSLLVEAGQAVTAVGVCDSSDALLNTLGAALAALAAGVVRSAVRGARP